MDLSASLSHVTGFRLGELDAVVGNVPFESSFAFFTGAVFPVVSLPLELAKMLICKKICYK